MSPPSVEDLKGHPILGALDSFSLERLIQAGRVDELRRHDVLCVAGERSDRAMLILDGTVKVTLAAPNQREVILDLLGAGDMVGEEAVADERTGYGAKVMRDAAVLCLPSAGIRALFSRNPDFSVAWMKNAYATKGRLQQRVSELAYGNIEDRLFRLLSHLVKQHGVKTSKGNAILRFPLTHQELANLIGATRETTTVAVGRLRSAGMIGFRERKIIVKERLRGDAPLEENSGKVS